MADGTKQAGIKQTGMNQAGATPRRFAWQGEMSEVMCSAFAEDGYLVIEDFFAAAQCDALKAHAQSLMDGNEAGEDLVIFSAAGQAHAKADYFRTSGDKIRFFLEEGAVDETGQLRVPMREAVNNGREFHGRLMNYHKNGTSLVNSLVMSPLRDERGVVTHFIGIQRLAPAKSLDDAPAEYQFRAAL